MTGRQQIARVAPLVLLVVLVIAGLRGVVPAPRWNGPLRADGLAVGIASMIVGCVTCCVGFLPYLSTVATLPLAIFWRCYSVYLLQQFGPQYAIIVEPPPAIGFPVMPYPPQ